MIIVLFIGIVLTFIIYNVNDWIVYEIIKDVFINIVMKRSHPIHQKHLQFLK